MKKTKKHTTDLFVQKNFHIFIELIEKYAQDLDKEIKVSKKHKTKPAKEAFADGLFHGIASSVSFFGRVALKDGQIDKKGLMRIFKMIQQIEEQSKRTK